jgi:hypothetical protein
MVSAGADGRHHGRQHDLAPLLHQDAALPPGACKAAQRAYHAPGARLQPQQSLHVHCELACSNTLGSLHARKPHPSVSSCDAVELPRSTLCHRKSALHRPAGGLYPGVKQLLAVVSPNGPSVPSALLNSLRLLLQITSSGVAVSRLPGLAVYYTDTLKGLPQVFEQLLATAPTLHKAVVFLHIRQVRPNLPSYRPLLLLYQRHHAFSSFSCSRMTLRTHIQLSPCPHTYPLSCPSYPAGPWHAGSARNIHRTMLT